MDGWGLTAFWACK